MYIDLDNMDHAIAMVNGFEAISLRDFDNSDACYAQTVLKMNGCDMNAIAGQEGFMSALKAGGKKFIEMVMNFLKRVKEFFFGSRGTKSDTAVNELGKATTFNVKLIKAAPNEKLDKLLEEAKESVSRLDKIISGEYGSIRFESYDEFAETIQDVRDGVMRKFDIPGLSITKLPNADYKSRELSTAIHDVNMIMLDNKATGAKDGVVLLKDLATAEKLKGKLEELRKAAKETMHVMSKDLEVATPDLKRVGEIMGEDENLNQQYKRLEGFTRAIIKADAKLVKLVKDVEKYLGALATTTAAMVKKIDPDNFKDLRKFEEFMNSEQGLNL